MWIVCKKVPFRAQTSPPLCIPSFVPVRHSHRLRSLPLALRLTLPSAVAPSPAVQDPLWQDIVGAINSIMGFVKMLCLSCATFAAG